MTASTRDSGYGVEYPASSPYVTAVGGTSLSASGGNWTETAWNGAGSGCSAYIAQPPWQSTVRNVTSVCGKRAVADVSADADPNTGVVVYNSSSYEYVKAGWQIWGDPSVASPIISKLSTATMTDGVEPSGSGMRRQGPAVGPPMK